MGSPAVSIYLTTFSSFQ